MTKQTVDGKQVDVAGDFVWFTYAQVQERIDAIGSGMLHFDMAPANDIGHKLVGLFSKNRMEWVIAEQACHAYGMVDVPLYDTLGHEAIVFIVNQTGMATVFCDVAGTAKLIAAKKGDIDMPNFKNIVQFEDVTDAQRESASAAGLTLRSFAEVMDAGKKTPAKHLPPKPEDLAFICYTSGTTGMPKGAMISHRNMVADASSAYTARLQFGQKDIHLSYLPLAHVFERLVQSAVWMTGACVGFYQGDTLKLIEDIKALRPTIFPSVPRLYNRIYDKIMGGVEETGGRKARIFKKAYEAKRQALLNNNKITHGLWDKIVFRKVAARVGLERCHLMLTGSAPIAPHVMEFLRIVFSCHVVEGYGQTECSAASTLTDYDDQASKGHVGGPLACNDVKLVSVGEMGYLVTDTVHGQETDASGKIVNAGIPCEGRGEVCYRGPNVFSGYYKDAEKTKEALDADGWLHSGDIGLWDKQGHIRIIDRKKNIFKLSQGEYVAAEKIENVYIKSALVAQSFVYGDSLHSMLVGIVVPDADRLTAWAKKNGKDGQTVAQLCTDADVKKAVMEDMASMAKEARLQGFECVKDIHLEPTPFTPDDLLTPSFKLKRAEAKKKYGAQIDEMYNKIEKIAGMTGLKQGAA
jgi:long-chain acyl-CoA synthetase